MSIFEKIFKSLVYSTTEKPKHYVHVDKPKTFQELRQVQYNNWCRAKGVYNGSYLPTDPNKLCESGKKGWIEKSCVNDKTGLHRTFQRKSNGQIVDYHYSQIKKNGIIVDEHYHWWEIFSLEKNPHKLENEKYRNRYGDICLNGSKESHLAPLDKDYNYK